MTNNNNVATLEAPLAKQIVYASEGSNQQVETWIDASINGHQLPLYEVSNLGHVRVKEHLVTYIRNGKLVSTLVHQRVLKPKNNGSDYLQVAVREFDGKVKWYLVSRLVMDSYNPVYADCLTDVDHIDNNRTNNQLTNLQRVTHADNLRKEHRMVQYRHPVTAQLPTGYQIDFNSITQASNYFDLSWQVVKRHIVSGTPTKKNVYFVLKK